ncbi:alanine racemase [Patescibacteria group bacterium]|nr:alanine racemase [Patescibacteria group bacterium]
MLSFVRSFFKRHYEPLNRIEISSSRLCHNYEYLSKLTTTIQIAPVVKSNAYGHGAKHIVQCLDCLQPPFFCVDSLYEAYELLKFRVKTPILIMGMIHPKSLDTKRLPFSFAVSTLEVVDALKIYQPSAHIHIFVDTGMHREGVPMDELPQFLEYIKTKTPLTIDGLMSHFGKSDDPNDPFTKMQVTCFLEAQEIMKNCRCHPRWIHIANSGALLNHAQFNGRLGNMARTGIALYGIDPEGKNTNLQPVLEFKTHIRQIKKLKKGESLGYDFTFRAKNDMTIAILPLGYYDGIDRRLSNEGYVTIKGKESRIIGRVSMNITTVDVTSVPNVQVGQEVIVYSNQPGKKNSIQNAAAICKTIPYDLLVHLTPTTKRVSVK